MAQASQCMTHRRLTEAEAMSSPCHASLLHDCSEDDEQIQVDRTQFGRSSLRHGHFSVGLCEPTVLARQRTVGRSETAAEMRHIGKSPAIGDLAYCPMRL